MYDLIWKKLITLDVVAITESTEFLLTGCVPDIETNLAASCVESERMHFHAKCCYIKIYRYYIFYWN